MSIEQKIAELLAEADMVEQDPNNARNNVPTQEIGGAADKVPNVVNQNATEPEEEEDIDSDGVMGVAGQDPSNARAFAAPVGEDISVDVSADVAALTEGEELTEAFKEKAAVIFEAAVVNRVKDEVSRIQEQLTEQYEIQLNEEVEQIKEGLVEQIDGYLDYVVEQWIEQNEIALDQGLKSEILEGFIGGLKSLFEDHYIEMPEEKYDVLAGLQEEIQQLHSRLDEQVETNIDLKQKITGLRAQAVAGQLAEGMVETDKAKFYSLLEDLEVESVESFEKKAQVIKESYFNKKPAAIQTGTFVSDNPVTLTEEKAQPSIPPQIKSYVSILDNLKK